MKRIMDKQNDLFFNIICQLLEAGENSTTIAKMFTEDFNRAQSSYEKNQREKKFLEAYNAAGEALADAWNHAYGLVCGKRSIKLDHNEFISGPEAMQIIEEVCNVKETVKKILPDDYDAKIQKWFSDLNLN